LRQPSTNQHVATLRDYLQVARRRKWLIVQAVVVVPLAALAFSLTQQAQYKATAQVLVSAEDLGAALTGTQTQAPSNSTTDLQTQAELARVPAVAARAIRALHLSMTPGELLAQTSASASTTSNILTFTATDHDAAKAARLATAYARAYVRYRFASETAPIEAAKKGLEKRIAATPRGALRNTLIENEQKLDELTALKTNDASVVKNATGATQTAPRTKRNVVLGLLLGIFLGIGLAFLREALDTRVRSAEVIADRLELPLLGRLPVPPRDLRLRNELVMMGDPRDPSAEAFRVLRTNVEFAALGKDVRTIMVTSALEREGKSTTLANLAVALARAGQRVVLVDLDLRRPFVDRFFSIGDRAGLTQVALGHVSLDEALVPVSIAPTTSTRITLGSVVTGSGQVKIVGNGNGYLNGRGDGAGSLHVLASGPIPPDPGEFVGTPRLTEVLEELRDRADVVLVDAPPLFHVGDGLVLSAKVDAAVLVTRMEVLRRPMLAELRRLLDNMPATVLGFVVTGAEAEESYGDGYGGYYARPYERKLEGEVQQ
jgi:Mrp family chromosome partitioning ATPase/capsular polysaccharide biosynthesis protein